MKKFELEDPYREVTYRAFKKAVIWAVITGMALTKTIKAYRIFNLTYGVASVAQLADEAGVAEEIMKKGEKYYR